MGFISSREQGVRWLILPDGALVLAGSEIFEKPTTVVIFSLMIHSGIPHLARKLWVANVLARLGVSIDIPAKKCGIFAAKRPFDLGKLQTLLRLWGPSLNQAQSADGAHRWNSHVCPRLRPFLPGLYDSPTMECSFRKLAKYRRVRTYDLWAVSGNSALPRQYICCVTG